MSREIKTERKKPSLDGSHRGSKKQSARKNRGATFGEVHGKSTGETLKKNGYQKKKEESIV